MNAFAAWLGTLDWGKVNRPWFRAAVFLVNDRGSRSTQTSSGIQAFVASPEDGSTLKFDRHGARKPDGWRASSDDVRDRSIGLWPKRARAFNTRLCDGQLPQRAQSRRHP